MTFPSVSATFYSLLIISLIGLNLINANDRPKTWRAKNLISGIVTTTPLPNGYIFYPGLNTAYKYHNERLPWLEAKKKCIEEGGRMAIIDTDPKIDLIWNLKPLKTYVWIGISRETKRSDWVTVDSGTIVPKIPWSKWEPSGPFNCLAVKCCSHRGLSNEPCCSRKKFVCEIRPNDTRKPAQ